MRNVVSASTRRLPVRRLLAGAIALVMTASSAFAGGPRWVAGKSYFDPAAKGIPLHWKDGNLRYYLDQGDLSLLVNHCCGPGDSGRGCGSMERRFHSRGQCK